MVGVIEQLYLVLYADHVGIEGPADTACCRQQGVNLALDDYLSSTTWTVAPLSVAVPVTLVWLAVVALMLMR